MTATSADFDQLITHYRAELEKARTNDPTGEGAELFEGLMNAALEDRRRTVEGGGSTP